MSNSFGRHTNLYTDLRVSIIGFVQTVMHGYVMVSHYSRSLAGRPNDYRRGNRCRFHKVDLGSRDANSQAIAICDCRLPTRQRGNGDVQHRTRTLLCGPIDDVQRRTAPTSRATLIYPSGLLRGHCGAPTCKSWWSHDAVTVVNRKVLNEDDI